MVMLASAAIDRPGVYKIEHRPTGRVYVGSGRSIRSRLMQHRAALARGKNSCQALQQAWSEAGESAFEATPLLVCSPDDLRFYERLAIEAYGAAATGFNVQSVPHAGRMQPHSEETKRKIGAANAVALKGRKGQPMPAHVKEILVATHRGKSAPPHVVEAARAANRGNSYHLGQKHDEAARLAMSEKTRGEKHPKAILTEDDVRAIRRLSAQGASGIELARRYGVHHDTVYQAIARKTWRHVE